MRTITQSALMDPGAHASENQDRRVSRSDRRTTTDRRSNQERRNDNRLAPAKHPKTLKAWLRALTNSRLGVDRRKRVDRRSSIDRRQPRLESILTKEELADLLGE